MNPQPNTIRKYSNGDQISIFDYTKGLMYATKNSLNCINGYGYTNYLNKGFPHQLLYRNIEIINN